MKTAFFSALCVLAGSVAYALNIQVSPDQFTVSGSRVQLTVRDARIVSVKSVQSGVELTSATPGMNMLTAGLGNMTGLAEELSRVHFPWGEPSVGQNVKRQKTALYGICGPQTVKRFETSQNQVVARWIGLYVGDQFYPDDWIELTFQKDQNGAVVMQRQGGGRSGIFGLSVPVENLSPTGKIYLPSFGGLEYDASAASDELIGLQDTTLFIEAPLMIYVGQKAAFGMWVEDEQFRPYFGFFERGPQGAAFSLEGLNLIPYETQRATTPPAIKFDLFDNSGWIAAARPYRNWYQKTFAKEIAVRDAPSWADDIMVIADGGNEAPGFERLASMFKPENVLVQIWQARKQGFTTDIPDYTPRDHYPALVQKLHGAGLKVMCYVCTLCAVYRSPVWDRDQVGEFFLTRKNSITQYNGNENAFDENMIGTIRAAKGEDQYAHLQPNAFLYGDPLSKGWRDYFCRIIKHMNDSCGTDANYQDTLGCTADTGNGMIDGLSGAQGNAAFTRELQHKLGVPMAAEFGPAPIAFGVRWPTNQARAWGGEGFRKYRSSRQHPISPFLFGYRTWVSSIRLSADELYHAVLAASDALSGFGMVGTNIPDQTAYGFEGQMLLRAKLFADQRLRPYYPETSYPENIKALYQNREGEIYRYYNNGTLQKMLNPEGRALYGRLHGVSRLLDQELFVPRYPIWDEAGVYNLNPDNYYALFPRKNAKMTLVHTGQLTDGMVIKSYYETPDYAYMELTTNGSSSKPSLTLNVDERFTRVLVNDIERSCSGKITITETFPLRLVFFKGQPLSANEIRIVNPLSGLQDGEPEALPQPRKLDGRLFYSVNYKREKVINSIVKIDIADAALDFAMVNLQKQYGDGAIVKLLINGQPVQAFDCATWNGKGHSDENNNLFDNRFREWRVPLGKYLGNHILISVAVDNKKGPNADMQFITLPEIISDPAQKFIEKIKEQPEDQDKRPAGIPEKTLLAEWGSAEGKKEKSGMISSRNFIELDSGKEYFLSGSFRSTDGQPVAVTLGLIQYDSAGQIHGVHVNPIPESESMLSHVAKKGENFLMVFDASRWVPKGMVALDAAKDASDLPNRNLVGPVTDIKLMGGDYKVTLGKPLDNTIPSETKVRMHFPRETFEYVKRITAKDQWVTGGGRIQVLPKAKRAQFLIISEQPVLFHDIRVEVFPNDPAK